MMVLQLIRDAGLEFRTTSNISSESANGRIMLQFQDGQYQLLLTAKLATTSTGIDVTGTATMDGISSDGNVSVVGAGNTRTIGFDFYGSSKYNFHIDGTTDADKMFVRRGTTNVANFANNGDISFYEDTGTTPKFHWSSSAESLGIGTDSPDSKLDVSRGSSGEIARFTSPNGTNSYITIGRDGSTSEGFTAGYNSSNGDCTLTAIAATHPIIFKQSTTERMRIDSSGNLLVGSTSSNNALNGPCLEVGGSNGNSLIVVRRNATSAATQIYFKNPNGYVGQIQTNGSATSYITSSDYRLKENVIELTGATERLKQLNPSRFNFIADADTTVDGFLAHQVADVVPEAISGEKDAVDADGNPEYQGIDQSKLVPLLVATIQELEARITQLENN